LPALTAEHRATVTSAFPGLVQAPGNITHGGSAVATIVSSLVEKTGQQVKSTEFAALQAKYGSLLKELKAVKESLNKAPNKCTGAAASDEYAAPTRNAKGVYRNGQGILSRTTAATAEACKQLCSSAADAVCRAISYEDETSACVLHTAVGASDTNTRGSSAGWDFYKLKKTPSPTCVYVSPGRGKWSKKLTTVPHAENPDFTLAQCTELCTKDAKCTQAAYQYTTRVPEGKAANTNICITYEGSWYVDSSEMAQLFDVHRCAAAAQTPE